MGTSRAAIILAAGQGTRMKSKTVKVLHEVGGRSMLDWAIDLARAAGADDITTVWGQHSPAVARASEAAGVKTALQDPPDGTGHAVQCAEAAVADKEGLAIVLYADTPLITPETVQRVFDALDDGASVAVLGFEPEDPAAYGRLVLTPDGDLDRIVEFKDASEDERGIGLVNSGVLAAPSALLFDLLGEVTNDNANGEYYLTDVVELARKRDLRAVVVRAAEDEVLGVNSRIDLAEAERAFQRRMRNAAMSGGVTLQDPDTTYFSFDTVIERDVIVGPNVVFGPGVTVHEDARIHAFSHLEGCTVESGASVGPYARLRPGAAIGPDAKIGNFVEVKKAQIEKGAKVSHLSYVGDARIGAGANIGAGTITCNYDGFDKYQTVVGEGAFIGSNTSLVAPVTIGDGAFTGSGGVITRDVPENALALARGEQSVKEGWATRFRAVKAARKNKKD